MGARNGEVKTTGKLRGEENGKSLPVKERKVMDGKGSLVTLKEKGREGMFSGYG